MERGMKRELSRELSSTCWLPGKDTEQQPEIRCRGLDKYILTHAGCWENTRKACKSRAEGE